MPAIGDTNVTFKALKTTFVSLPSIDARLLAHMERDYRTPLREVAASVGISRSTARRRLDALHSEGIFRGYQVEINRSALGLDRLVYMEVKTNPKESWLLRAIESSDRCIQSDGVIGEYGLIFKMAFADGSELASSLRAMDSLVASSAYKSYRIVDTIETYKERGEIYRPRRRMELDDVDRALLRTLLFQDSSTPFQLWKLSRSVQDDVGRKVSRSTVQKRIQRMVDAGLIERFTIRPRAWSRNPGVHAYVRAKVDPSQMRHIATDVMSPMDQVMSLYRTGEEYGLFGEVATNDLSSLDGLIKGIYRAEGIMDTFTTIVLERRKEACVPMGSLR